MSHWQQVQYVGFVKEFLPRYFRGQRVLEIGSLNINGTVRDFFQACDYIGLDVSPGRGVDLVCQGQDYDAPDDSYDVVISCEVMEHNPQWRETFRNMVRLCKPHGLIVMTCATIGRPEHGTTRTSPTKSPLTVSLGWDYYKNLEARDFRSAVDLDACMERYGFFYNYSSNDLYFFGIKNGSPPKVQRTLRALVALKVRYLARNLLRWQPLRSMVLLKLFGEPRHDSGSNTG